MSYELLKSFHILSVVVWIGALITVPFVLARVRTQPGAAVLSGPLRAAASAIMTPAMIAALGLGLTLAAYRGGLGESWLQAKLLVVTILAALHGVLAVELRRAATEPDRPIPMWISAIGWASLGCAAGVVVLAVVKP